jgi:hypothetical protein
VTIQRKPSITIVIGLILLSFALACQVEGLFAPTPTLTNTPTRTPTATPEPTTTPTPRPMVTGILTDISTNNPLPDARVTLCKVLESGTECVIDVNLAGLTDIDGAFEIPVPPGEYALVYNVSGSKQPKWDGKKLNYTPPELKGFGGQTLMQILFLSLSDGKSIPKGDIDGCFFQMFTDDGLTFSGYFYYKPLDIALVLYLNKLVSVEVKDSPAKINLAVWSLNGKVSCDKFYPYR